MQADLLIPSPCAICGSHTPAEILYPANFHAAHLNADIFSARRLPDRIHYQMVRCTVCGLVRSDPIARPDLIEKLYQASRFTYTSEVESLKLTYGRYLQSLDDYGANHTSLLDVGCGNGFFLETARDLGYADLWGVEPSADAVAQAPTFLAGKIKQDIFRPGLFAENQFSVICFFQVFDHFPDPASVLDETYRILAPGGLVLAINHDIEALQARLLGSRSPIVDIEHTYLYSKITQSRIFREYGFEIVASFDVVNRYPLHYWLQLSPLPATLKRFSITLSKAVQLGYIPLSLKVGNQGLIARKPQ
jgi:SAM-dependent methyltransferase